MPRLSTQLSPPTTDEQARSQALSEHLRELIKAQGPLSFAEYMERCLYEPELGYYTSQGAIFGEAGDFVTAPEMGALFAQGLARQIAALAAAENWPQPWRIVEVGAGSGRLAADLVTALQALGTVPAQYSIVERSESLRQRQREQLAPWTDHPGLTIEHLDHVPDNVCGVIVANEVLDALPVERVCLGENGWQRLGVDWCDGELYACKLPMTANLQALVDQRLRDLRERHEHSELPVPYTTEIHHAIDHWLGLYAQALQRGVVMLVDYGYPRHEYYHPQRDQGSLICYYRHQAHADPLRWPGTQDLTAFVDFTTVAEAADQHGLDVLGYTSQAHFLLNSGVLESLQHIDDPIAMARLAEQARRLMLPGEMGERFQVMMLGKGVDDAGPGFEVDLRYRL